MLIDLDEVLAISLLDDLLLAELAGEVVWIVVVKRRCHNAGHAESTVAALAESQLVLDLSVLLHEARVLLAISELTLNSTCSLRSDKVRQGLLVVLLLLS